MVKNVKSPNVLRRWRYNTLGLQDVYSPLFDYQFLRGVAEFEDIDARRQVVHVYS